MTYPYCPYCCAEFTDGHADHEVGCVHYGSKSAAEICKLCGCVLCRCGLYQLLVCPKCHHKHCECPDSAAELREKYRPGDWSLLNSDVFADINELLDMLDKQKVEFDDFYKWGGDKITKLHSQIKDLKAALAAKDAELVCLRGQIAGHEELYQRQHAKVNDLKTKLEAKERESQAYRDAIKLHVEEKQQLETILEAKEKENIRYRKSIRIRIEQYRRIRDENEKLKAERSNLSLKITRLKAENERLIAELADRPKYPFMEIDRLKTALKAKDVNLCTARGQIISMEVIQSGHEMQIRDLQAELERQRNG